jgi:hypothetical protein
MIISGINDQGKVSNEYQISCMTYIQRSHTEEKKQAQVDQQGHAQRNIPSSCLFHIEKQFDKAKTLIQANSIAHSFRQLYFTIVLYRLT